MCTINDQLWPLTSMCFTSVSNESSSFVFAIDIVGWFGFCLECAASSHFKLFRPHFIMHFDCVSCRILHMRCVQVNYWFEVIGLNWCIVCQCPNLIRLQASHSISIHKNDEGKYRFYYMNVFYIYIGWIHFNISNFNFLLNRL